MNPAIVGLNQRENLISKAVIPEQGISPHQRTGLTYGLFEQLTELNLFVAFGRLCISHDDLLSRLFWLGSPWCANTLAGRLLFCYFFVCFPLGRFRYSR